MYVEISPRQSGKTTRLIEAATNYLRSNSDNTIAIITPTIVRAQEIKNKIVGIIGNKFESKIRIGSSVRYLEELTSINYYFFDDFSSIEPNKILVFGTNLINGYYCTTPCGKRSTINMVVNNCHNNNIDIKFFNPWTELRIREQLGFDDYTREYVLNDWVRYMTSIGVDVTKLKENWFQKRLKKHKFV